MGVSHLKTNLLRAALQAAKPVVERFPTAATVFRAVRDALPMLDEPQLTPLGFKLAGNPAMTAGVFEPDETRLIRQILRGSRIDTFVNVGANIGYYCCLARSLDVDVVAIEPIERNLRYLLRNLKANGWQDRVEVFPVALSSAPGLVEIYGGGTGASLVKGWANIPEHYVRLVPCSTLDNLVAARLAGKRSLILVDIEGAERRMLEGAKQTLTSQPAPIWMVEISSTEHQPQGRSLNPDLLSTFEVFWSAGYVSVTADAARRWVDRQEVLRIASGEPNTLSTHNFVFAMPSEMSLVT